MKTIVLDDDPTGTQSAQGVGVLLEWDVDVIEDALRTADSVYILTNTRAMAEKAAVTLLTGIREQCVAACDRLGADVTFVLRGDSTLRGHVFPESEVFASPASLLAFVPAYPAGGRITRDGVHLVQLDGRFVPAHDTEYAADPVFPFDTAVLRDYVGQRSARSVVTVDLATLRAGSADLGSAVLGAANGSVLTFDAETDGDVERIATALRAARGRGARRRHPLGRDPGGRARRRAQHRPARRTSRPRSRAHPARVRLPHRRGGTPARTRHRAVRRRRSRSRPKPRSPPRRRPAAWPGNMPPSGSGPAGSGS